MKRGDFTPQPGDLFTWYYDDNIKCHPEETIWSTHMKRMVPCAGTNLLIALTDTDIWWMNSNCFIHTRVDDMAATRTRRAASSCFIHARVDEAMESRGQVGTVVSSNSAFLRGSLDFA